MTKPTPELIEQLKTMLYSHDDLYDTFTNVLEDALNVLPLSEDEAEYFRSNLTYIFEIEEDAQQ